MLKGLTGRQKEIIYLRFIHEMSFDEISEIMEINIQSARNLLARSMEKLRKEAILAIILFFYLKKNIFSEYKSARLFVIIENKAKNGSIYI